MTGLLSLARRLCLVGTWMSGALVLATAVAITAEVVLRKLFGFVFAGGALTELAGYVLAISVAWSASLTLISRAHVRIDTIQTLVGPRAASILDVLSLVVFVGAFGLLAYKAWDVFLRSYSLGSTSMTGLATPLAVPQFIWALGWTVLVLVAVLLTVATGSALFRGDRAAVRRLAGSRSIEEDLEDHRLIHAGGGANAAGQPRDAA